MRLRTEPTDRGSSRPSNRRGGAAAPPRLRQIRAALRRPATSPTRRCDARRFQSLPRQGQDRQAARSGLPPRFGLTFRRMTGARRRQGQFSAHVLCLLSMFALLAFALFPVAAGADSSGVQYSDAPPTATGKEPLNETPAKSSKSKSGGVSNPSNTSNSQEAHPSDGESSPGSTASKSDTAPPSSANAGQNDAGQQGNQGHDSQAKSQGGQQQGQQSAAKPTTTSNDGGGSSPLVPALIAIAVLAAISVGAMMLRQRRRRGTPVKTVSPKAG
jgi:hypothetical protein